MKKLYIVVMIFVLSLFMSGCISMEQIEVKAGIKNSDFEYIKQGKIKKIIIQNSRDNGYRFVVTDERAIDELYDILSTAKVVSEKTSLAPDYTFEMQESPTKVYKFNYVAGLDKQAAGNLYSNNKVYLVSKRIDDDIIKNFGDIRKPQKFEQVYYDSIFTALDSYNKNNSKGGKVGINIKDDVNVAKFLLSTELEDFKRNLSNKFNNAFLIENDKDTYDILMAVSTEGYKSAYENNKLTSVYKATITFTNVKENSEKKYYIFDKYADGKWNIELYTGEKPKDF